MKAKQGKPKAAASGPGASGTHAGLAKIALWAKTEAKGAPTSVNAKVVTKDQAGGDGIGAAIPDGMVEGTKLKELTRSAVKDELQKDGALVRRET